MTLPIYELEDYEGIDEQLKLEENFAVIFQNNKYCFLFRKRKDKASLVYIYKRYQGTRKDTYMGLNTNLNYRLFAAKVKQFALEVEEDINKKELDGSIEENLIPNLTAKEGVAMLIKENQKLKAKVDSLAIAINELKGFFNEQNKTSERVTSEA